ncbi:MAG: formylglycine-generating enzyme family protein [Desulfurivibrio sp.]|nr:formylglycine-generating enzyme family protein [Desulfurivibrio sp.]
MPALFNLQGIDEALDNLDLKQGTLKAELARVVRSYFVDDQSLQSITNIPADELVFKLWGPCEGDDLKAKKKNFSSLKSALNKSLKDLDKAGKNEAGIILGRDNVFIVSEERKDDLLKQMGISPNSPHLLHDMFEAFKKFFSENIKDQNAEEVKDLLAEFEETQKKLRKMAGLESDTDQDTSGSKRTGPESGGGPSEELAEEAPAEEAEVLDEELAEEAVEESPEDTELLEDEVEILEEDELEEVLAEEEPTEEVEVLEEDAFEEVVEEDAEETELLEDEIDILEEDELEEVEDATEPLEEKPHQPKPLEVLSKYIEAEEAINQGDLLRETQEEFINQILERFMPKFIKIPAGSYMAGSPSPKGLEQPLRNARLNDFYFGQSPVTNDLFDMFVRETGYTTDAEEAGYGIVFEGRCTNRKDPETGREIFSLTQGTIARHVSGANWRHPGGPGSTLEGKHNHPVVQISHNDAKAFAAWAGKRLPTEEEWEAAARGASGQLFPWGVVWRADLGNFEATCLGGTTSVEHFGRKGMSPLGIHDMLGNVSEWTSSPYQRQSNIAPGTPEEKIYILKGGSWITGGTVTAAWRQIELGKYWANTIGFRCAV